MRLRRLVAFPMYKIVSSDSQNRDNAAARLVALTDVCPSKAIVGTWAIQSLRVDSAIGAEAIAVSGNEMT